jgi:ketosteroid isomerase-like protein
LETLGANEEVLDFPQHQFVAQGDSVVVFSTLRARAKSTGRDYETSHVNAFTVRSGMIQKVRGYWDTAAVVEAHRK